MLGKGLSDYRIEKEQARQSGCREWCSRQRDQNVQSSLCTKELDAFLGGREAREARVQRSNGGNDTR